MNSADIEATTMTRKRRDWREETWGPFMDAHAHNCLLDWLATIGMTLDDLLDEIRKHQPGDRLTDTLGVGSKLPNPMPGTTAGLQLTPEDEQRILLTFRGLQNLCVDRWWQQEGHHQPKQPETGQLELFR
jgi:hypothetical protein